MANEAVLKVNIEQPIDFTVADGTAITRGTLCKLTDPRTASASNGTGDMIAGIAARDKIASDGRTQLAMYRRGIFDMKCSGAVTLGKAVMSALGAGNEVMLATTATSGAAIIGHALETGSDAEVIEVWVDIGAGKA